MRTLAGIDGQNHFPAALALLGRLQFADNRTLLTHVEGPVLGSFAGSPILYDGGVAEVAAALSQAGHELLARASGDAEVAGLSPIDTIYAIGGSSTTLMRLAADQRCDLVAIGAGRHGPMECFFLGSVGRAFAIGGHQSFLVARGDGDTGPVRAVFAHDGSEYARRCFAHLLDMNPKGLRHISVVTATESNVETEFSVEVGYDDRNPQTFTDAEKPLRSQGQSMVERIVATGRTADFRLVPGFPADALGQAMVDTGADLMVVGSRGHGLIERVLIGSLALHIVVAEQYPVLVLRMPEDE